MMREPRGPEEWAGFLHWVMEEAFGPEHFPINISETAKLFTVRKYPKDPITIVRGHDLPGLEGMLIRNEKQNREWAIFFNQNNAKRRIRFTLAHEFGHYLLHRRQYPNGFRCQVPDIPLKDRQLAHLEHEADTFAAHFLMPIADFSQLIGKSEFTNLNMIGVAADRYGVSLTAAIRQWLRYTQHRAVLIVSQDGFIQWSEASLSAQLAGTHFPNVRRTPVEVPESSLATQRDLTNYPKDGVPMPKGTWFADHEVLEMGIHSDQHDIVITLLMLDFET
ncbi:MAG: ImmA/IrrE family metallo-endopeptidase [Magnetococcales bacterium]|nr:ImmA/IrrE family metallo-endopeptidase [Magnetococcales bacterium]